MAATGTSVSGLLTSAKTRMAMSEAVRACLAELETEHKTKQIKRSSTKGSKPDPRTWTTRQGQLRRSFHIEYKQGDLYGAYGSDLRRAKHIEEGGTITAKNRYLAIPTDAAPKDVWPRYVPDLFFYMTKAGRPALATSEGGGLKVMYHLRESVTLPPRPALQRAVEATEASRTERLMQVFDQIGGAR